MLYRFECCRCMFARSVTVTVRYTYTAPLTDYDFNLYFNTSIFPVKTICRLKLVKYSGCCLAIYRNTGQNARNNNLFHNIGL